MKIHTFEDADGLKLEIRNKLSEEKTKLWEFQHDWLTLEAVHRLMKDYKHTEPFYIISEVIWCFYVEVILTNFLVPNLDILA